MHEDFLLTIAEVSGALLGFVGVVLILGRRSEGIISTRDRSGLFHLVYAASGTLFFSLLMYVFLASFEQVALIWRVGVGLSTLYILFGVSRAIMEGRSGGNRLSDITRHFLSVVTFSIVGMNVAIVLGYISSFAPFAYTITMTLMVAVAVSYFVPFVFGVSEDEP